MSENVKITLYPGRGIGAIAARITAVLDEVLGECSPKAMEIAEGISAAYREVGDKRSAEAWSAVKDQYDTGNWMEEA